MPYFTPPTDNWLNLSDFDVETPPTQEMLVSYRLLRHFQAMPRGRNVYKLLDGTFTENEPADTDLIAVTYLGGHQNFVSSDEAADLTAAGYGAYIS